MNGSRNQTEKLELRNLLGIILLVIALLGLYWIAEAVFLIWNSPRSVPFVSLFIELLEENPKPIIKTKEGSEINLPASWPVVVGIFLSIVLISSIGLLVRSFLSNALLLLFPHLHTAKGSKMSVLKSMLSKHKE